MIERINVADVIVVVALSAALIISIGAMSRFKAN